MLYKERRHLRYATTKLVMHLGVISPLTSQSEAVLLRLEQPPEHGDLHVQLHLQVLQVLVLLQLVRQLVQEPLDLAW